MTTNSLRRFRLLYASIASFVLLVALFFLENFAASEGSLVTLLIYAPQHGFALLPLLLTLMAWRQRDFKLLWFNGLTLLGWALGLLGWNVPLAALNPFDSARAPFRVMTYNVQRGERGFATLAQTIARQKPDILCLQETQDPPPKVFSYPGDAFQAHFKVWNSARGGDVMTLSRFALVSQRTWPLSGTRRILETVWQTPRGQVRVLNVHIAKSEAEKQLQDRNFATFAVQLGANARAASQTRLEQLPALEAALGGDLPLIVAGDFNAPRRGRFYRALTNYASDAWKQAGWGDGATFPSRWPLLGIDHIFLRGARATRALVPRSRASDHLPLVADVVLNGR